VWTSIATYLRHPKELRGLKHGLRHSPRSSDGFMIAEAHVYFRNRFLHLTSVTYLRRLEAGLATGLELTLVKSHPHGRAIATIGP
jgi:hypothetical protein